MTDPPAPFLESKPIPAGEDVTKLVKSPAPNDGFLLRLFKSDLFDCYLHMYYLYTRTEEGITQYLVNLLYKRTDEEIHFYLAQLCCLCLDRHSQRGPGPLILRFLLEKASRSIHLAIKTSWLFQAFADDPSSERHALSLQLNQQVEMAAVNSNPEPPGGSYYAAQLQSGVPAFDLFKRWKVISKLENSSLDVLATPPRPSSISAPRSAMKRRVAPGFVTCQMPARVRGSRVTLSSVYCKLGSPWIYSAFKDAALMSDEMQQFIIKQRRCDYFNLLTSFTSHLIETSKLLATEPDRSLRLPLLCEMLRGLNEWMFCRRCVVAASEGLFAMTGLSIPLNEFGGCLLEEDCTTSTSTTQRGTQIVRFVPEACRVLSSKKRAPYLLVFEVADLDEDLNRLPQIFRLTTDEFCRAMFSPRSPQSHSAGLRPASFEQSTADNPAIEHDTIAEEGGPLEKQSSENLERLETTKTLDMDGQKIETSEVSPAAEMLETSEANTMSESVTVENSAEVVVKSTSKSHKKGSGGRRERPQLWKHLYVYDSILKELRERGLYQPANSPSQSDSSPTGELARSPTLINETPLIALRRSMGYRVGSSHSSKNAVGQPRTAQASPQTAPVDDATDYATDAKSSNPRNSVKNLTLSHPAKITATDNQTTLGVTVRQKLSGSLGGSSTRTGSVSNGSSSANPKVAPVALEPELMAAEMARNAAAVRGRLWGELWESKKQRYRAQSPYGSLRSWNLACVLVKGGDDVRQEMLASQLIQQFKTIFAAANLPLYLRPYEILVTGASSGIMVFVPDTISIDMLKRRYGADSVHDVFKHAFADNPAEARKHYSIGYCFQNFIESHAAYSIVGYILQVRDRHNGNYLMDAQGHIIHIDYGFMLSNTPGNVNFEAAGFKLTTEFMDVIGGETSEHFQYFRKLVVAGFLEARKYAERLLLLVEMMLSVEGQSGDSQLDFIKRSLP